MKILQIVQINQREQFIVLSSNMRFFNYTIYENELYNMDIKLLTEQQSCIPSDTSHMFGPKGSPCQWNKPLASTHRSFYP